MLNDTSACSEPLEKLARRADGDWLESLPACGMAQFRKKIQQGGEPVFVLAQESSFLHPVWLLLLREKHGPLLRVTTPTNPLIRKLTSVRQVYQIARTSGLRSVSIPVDRLPNKACRAKPDSGFRFGLICDSLDHGGRSAMGNGSASVWLSRVK